MKTHARRAAPGSKGGGNFYRIVVRPKEQFVLFRNQDVGVSGHIERVAGRRKSGSWATQAWLIQKGEAHVINGRLVGDTPEAKKLLRLLGSRPRHLEGDVFRAKDRPNIPEKDKPTRAQRRARARNIQKAQNARRQSRSYREAA